MRRYSRNPIYSISAESDSEVEYQSCPTLSTVDIKVRKKISKNRQVVTALDRVYLPNRAAGSVFVRPDVSDTTLCRSSLRCSKKVGIKKGTETEEGKAGLKVTVLLDLDAKLLQVSKTHETIDHNAVLVTGNEQKAVCTYQGRQIYWDNSGVNTCRYSKKCNLGNKYKRLTFYQVYT